MAESAAMATRLVVAEEELKATAAAAAAEKKHRVDRGREAAAKRLERDLSNKGISQDDIDEHEEAEMRFELGVCLSPSECIKAWRGTGQASSRAANGPSPARWKTVHGTAAPPWKPVSVKLSSP